MTKHLPTVSIYVDEYGDRGFGRQASEYFCVTSVLIPNESHHHMRACVAGMQNVIGTPKPLHWREHFKENRQDRRAMASGLCASIPGLVVIYALAHKGTLASSDEMRNDNSLFYHYVTRLVLERAAFECQGWAGGPRHGRVVLSAIKGTKPETTAEYFARVQRRHSILSPKVKIRTPAEEDGLQVADLYQGMLATALTGASDDSDCGKHLHATRHQLRRDPTGSPIGWGLKLYPANLSNDLCQRSWWRPWIEL